MGKRLAVAIGACALAIVGQPLPAAGADTLDCPAGTERYAEYRLFFGRNHGDVEVVTDADWASFVAGDIATRFPDGFTVMDAAGLWRSPSGNVTRERSKILLVLTAPGLQGAQRSVEIADAYKHRFDQESVLRQIDSTCAQF